MLDVEAHQSTAINQALFPKNEVRFPRPYRKTFAFDGEFIDDAHLGFFTRPTFGGLVDIGIEGWLLPEDALKLYELAYFADGDILELGTYKGLSTSIMARAVKAARRVSRIVTLDISAEYSAAARTGMEQRREAVDLVDFHVGDANDFLALLGGRKFAVAFVDHSHRYADVRSASQHLAGLTKPGAFVLFHDYNDVRNGGDEDYGVLQGAIDGMPPAFEFYGCYGCTGLYRRS